MKTYDLSDIKKYIKDKYNKDIDVEEYNLAETNRNDKDNRKDKTYQINKDYQDNIGYQINKDYQDNIGYKINKDNQKNINNLNKKNNQEDIYQIKSDKYSQDEIDSAKTRILKYITYKKRTIYEVKTKFKTMYDEELLDEIIERFKSLGYINDADYIRRAVHDFIVLKHLSIFEIKNKLMAKGINKKDIENYISTNEDELKEYEINSAKHIVNKKRSTMEDIEIKQYLYKKGYREESIRKAIEE